MTSTSVIVVVNYTSDSRRFIHNACDVASLARDGRRQSESVSVTTPFPVATPTSSVDE